MNDGSNALGFLASHHIRDSAEEFAKLPLLEDAKGKRLDPKRLSRANTTFSFNANLPRLANFMKKEIEDGDKTFLFPKDA